MDIDNKVLKQLKEIAISKGYDKIVEVGSINNKPAYRLMFSSFKGGKIGYPRLYSYDKNKIVFELSFETVRKVIKQPLFQNGGKVVQQFRIHQQPVDAQ